MNQREINHWLNEIAIRNKQRTSDNVKGRCCSYLGIGLALAAWLIILT